MIFQGIYPTEGFNGISALIVSLIAILLVFLVLVIVIVVTHGIGLGLNKIEESTNILPREENKLLEEDEDAVVASLVATIEFNKETKKNARLVSIKRIDEEE